VRKNTEETWLDKHPSIKRKTNEERKTDDANAFFKGRFVMSWMIKNRFHQW